MALGSPNNSPVYLKNHNYSCRKLHRSHSNVDNATKAGVANALTTRNGAMCLMKLSARHNSVLCWLPDAGVRLAAAASELDADDRATPASIMDTPQYHVNHRYHSQGVAAGGSALLDAVDSAKLRLAKFILEASDSTIVNTRDFKGKTPLTRACYIKVSTRH